MSNMTVHGLEPGVEATIHLRTSQPIVPESPGPLVGKAHKVRKDGSVEFSGLETGRAYVVRAGAQTRELLAKDEQPKELPPPGAGADVQVRGARTTANTRAKAGAKK